MAVTILRGNIVSAPALGELEITERGYLVAEDGVLAGVFPRLPERWQGLAVEDWGGALILQSFADMHLHAPQYPMLGTGMDLPLLPWLEKYVFPTEARFAQEDYARTVYRRLARELIENGTTRVCMFSSLHRPATRILMEELERAGVTGCVGKVNMDLGGTPELRETTEESRRETLRWLEECGDFPHVRPILTPRFTPACSEELLEFLGRLAEERGLPVQSHLSENAGEIELVRRTHPTAAGYWDTYAQHGLWTNRTLMAHCVWSDAAERRAMADSGVTAVHCACSNNNLCSGTAPVRTLLREGVGVVLGSDIAGGDRLHMFDVAASAVRASKIRCMQDGTPFLTVAEAWYLATSAAAGFFGQAPGFAPGNRLHALVLEDDRLPPAARELSVRERFERSLYLRQEGAIRAVWSDGRKVLG
jgi:guanine deaminase